MEENKTFDIGLVSALRENKPRCVELNGRRIALVRLGPDVLAFQDECPHAEGPLSEGYMEEGSIVCPLHMWKFDVRTGRPTKAPPACSIKTFPVSIENEHVFITLP